MYLAGFRDFFEGSIEGFCGDKLIAGETLCQFFFARFAVLAERLDKQKRSDSKCFGKSLNGIKREVCGAALGIGNDLAGNAGSFRKRRLTKFPLRPRDDKVHLQCLAQRGCFSFT